MDYSAVNQYSETFCQVVSQIVQSELKAIKYDKTIRCTVTDASGANYSYYKVSDGATEYIAYSRGEEYKYGDSVYVTIPNGDVNEQKFIIGKAYGEIEPDYIPLKNFIPVEQWSMNNKIGIMANDNVDTILIPSEITENSMASDWNKKLNLDLFNCKDITHFVISAKFSTALPSCRRGIFGIKIELNFIDSKNEEQTEILYFLNNDMYGNIYQLKEVTQKFVFSLDQLDVMKIIGLQFYLYQQNDFFDFNGQRISKDPEDPKVANIVLTGFKIEAGYNSQVIKPNSVLIYAENEGKTYLNDKDANMGKINWLFITEQDKNQYKRWIDTPPTVGRSYYFEILEYDPSFKAMDTNTLERDQWKKCSLNLLENNYTAKINQDQSGLEVILYEIVKGNKIIVDKQRILFYKRKE